MYNLKLNIYQAQLIKSALIGKRLLDEDSYHECQIILDLIDGVILEQKIARLK
jgi:hypothetical protein